jgi:hypothetical protein
VTLTFLALVIFQIGSHIFAWSWPCEFVWTLPNHTCLS